MENKPNITPAEVFLLTTLGECFTENTTIGDLFNTINKTFEMYPVENPDERANILRTALGSRYGEVMGAYARRQALIKDLEMENKDIERIMADLFKDKPWNRGALAQSEILVERAALTYSALVCLNEGATIWRYYSTPLVVRVNMKSPGPEIHRRLTDALHAICEAEKSLPRQELPYCPDLHKLVDKQPEDRENGFFAMDDAISLDVLMSSVISRFQLAQMLHRKKGEAK